MIYADYSNAFDRVSHKLLILTLRLLSFLLYLLKWISSWLRNKSFGVPLMNFPWRQALLLVFLLYTNDLSSVIKLIHVLMYDDDVKLFSFLPWKQRPYLLHFDINNVITWISYNFITIKLKKNARNSHSWGLSRNADSFMDLGFYFTKNYVLICAFNNPLAKLDPRLALWLMAYA